MLLAKDVIKNYNNLQVLKGVSLEVKEGEVVSIVGASGAGKSTLLHILGSLDRPDAGEISIAGTSLTDMKQDKLANFRNEKIGFVFQFHNLLPEFTAVENICIPGFIKGTPASQVKKKADELMDILGISPRKDHKPSALSGGEQQRVAVARALINDPVIIFADEPSGNLDSKNAQELHQLFFKLKDLYQQTFVIVTHNAEFAQMANRKIEIIDGKILNAGNSE